MFGSSPSILRDRYIKGSITKSLLNAMVEIVGCVGVYVCVEVYCV